MNYYVYILSNNLNTVVHTGVTKDLVRRVCEHKYHPDPNSFTAKYGVEKLVYFEQTTDVRAAIERENRSSPGTAKRKTNLYVASIHSG